MNYLLLITCINLAVLIMSSGCGPDPVRQPIRETAVINSCWEAADSAFVGQFGTGGCGNITVYGFIDSVHLLVIHIAAPDFPLTENCLEIPLTDSTTSVTALVYQYLVPPAKDGQHAFLPPVCNDIGDVTNSKKVIADHIINGRLFVSKSKRRDAERRFRCTVKTENLVIQGKSGREIRVPKFVVHDVLVGWYAG